MLALGLFDLLKGLDFEETILTWGVAVALIVSRDAFTVRHDPITLRSAVWRVPLLARWLGLAVAMVAVWTGSHASFGNVATETFDLLRYQPGPMHFHHHIPIGVHMLEIGTLLMIAYVIFRPLAAPRTPPSPAARRVASDLVRAHGADTLAFFKLRADEPLHLQRGPAGVRRATRIENGVLLLSGDPVGPARRIPRAARAGPAVRRRPRPEARRARRQRAPVPAVRGARAPHDLPGRRGGRRRSSRFSLEGRPIRKVRQSVTPPRPRRATRPSCTSCGALDPGTIERVEEVLELGRQGAPERGFSMAMDSLQGEHDHDTLVVLARDDDRRDPRRPALRPLLRAPGGVAVVHAARPGDAQRADRVPGRRRRSSCCATAGSRSCRSTSRRSRKWMHSPEKRARAACSAS